MQALKAKRATYAKIDLKRYLQNLIYIKDKAKSDVIAILKADGYGHGAVALAKFLFTNNFTDIFAVATIEEALELRKILKDRVKIIILGYVDPAFFDDVIENALILTIYDFEIAKKYQLFLKNKDIKMPVILKIDTGMNRLGFDIKLNFFDFVSHYNLFDIKMVMTHLSSSDEDIEYTNYQLKLFDEFINKYHITSASAFNSSAIFNLNNKYQYVRPGIASFGYVYGCKINALKPVMSLHSKIVHVKKIHKGETVSYNRKFKAIKNMTIGVLPVGYADGYPRAFTNKAYTFLGDYKCDVLGTVCMDMVMIDITDVPESMYDKEVELLGDKVSGYEWGKWGDTIVYEHLCGISSRIPRIYVS